MLEVCIDSLESAVNAVSNGADELEVCSSLSQGGLTPSAGLVKRVVDMISDYMENGIECDGIHINLMKRPKVNVMIRCRAGSNFNYNSSEMQTMLEDIEIFKDLGVDRFVFGSLSDTRQIEDVNCIRVLAQAYPKPVTFHRAFDLCVEPIEAVDELIQLGFDRLLTSGQRKSVADIEAVTFISNLLDLYRDDIEIMPGAGINLDNVRGFIDMGCKIVHSSCKELKALDIIENDLGMGDLDHVYVTSGPLVKEMKEIIQ